MDNQDLKNSSPSPAPSQQEVNEFVRDAGEGNYAAAAVFIAKYPSAINQRSAFHETAIVNAVMTGQQSVVELLLENGAVTNEEDKNGWKPLFAAADKGRLTIVQVLLAHDAVFDEQDSILLTPMMRAARNGHRDIVEFLLEKGADVNAEDHRQVTALMLAAYEGHTEIVKLLLEKGADPDKTNKDKLTALEVACNNNRAETAVALLDWPKIKQQRAETKGKELTAARLERLKTLPPLKSPFKKKGP
jgi:ankyrin repeat protein